MDGGEEIAAAEERALARQAVRDIGSPAFEDRAHGRAHAEARKAARQAARAAVRKTGRGHAKGHAKGPKHR